MVEKIEARGCPFCGSWKISVDYVESVVECDNCRAMGPSTLGLPPHRTIRQAISNWNERSAKCPPDDSEQEVDKRRPCEDLLPCPFCLSRNVIVEYIDDPMWWGSCRRCAANGPMPDCFSSNTRKRGIAAWNSRVTNPKNVAILRFQSGELDQ